MNQDDIKKAQDLSKKLSNVLGDSSSKKKVEASKPPKDISFIKKLTGVKQPPKQKEDTLVRDYIVKNKPEPKIDTPEEIVGKINASSKKIGAHVIEGIPTPEEVVDAIKNLKGNDRIDISHIRNGENLARIAQGRMNDQRYHGGGDTVIAGTNVTITTNANGQKVINSTGGGGGSPGGVQYDVQLNDGAGGFLGSNNLNFQGGYLTINGDSGYGQLQFLNSPITGGYAGAGISGIDDQIIVGALAGDMTYWSSQAMNFSADTGNTNMLRINADGTINFPQLTASEILATDASKNLISLPTATYPSLTELSYVKGVTSSIQTQLNAKGAGTVTSVSVATANGFAGTVATATTTPAITITTTIGAGNIPVSNGTGFQSAPLTGTGNIVLATSPTFSGATITTSTFNGLTLTATTGTFTLTNGKTLSVAKTLTLDGTDSTTMTFPSTSASIARTDAAQTFTGIQTIPQIVNTPLAATVSSNAATITRANRINNFTNSSAATMAITLSTSGALDGDMLMVRIYDFSAVAQTIGWTNTEDSTVTAPTTSNGSTTLPLTVGFQFNGGSTKWRTIAKA